MSLRGKFILYLLFVHLAFAAFAVYFLWERRVWLLALEAFFIFSFLISYRLFNALLKPIELVNSGVETLKHRDFTSKFLPIKQPELDRLIEVYNHMLDELREERLRLQEQHYFLDKVLTASPSGILTFDFDERIALANPSAAKMLQADAANLQGKSLAELHSPFAEALSRLNLREAQILLLQGSRRVKCQKLQFLDHGFARSFILLEELTEELRRSEKGAYEKLIRMMSHEVNNSVGAISSLLHSLLNYKQQLRDADRHDFEHALHVAITRSGHLNAFMRGFAEVVRLPRPNLQPCDLPELLHEIALLFQTESKERDILWQWDVEQPLPLIAMDRAQMEQVFINLYKNAIEAIGERGTIRIQTGVRQGKNFVVIEDSGVGVAPEAQAQLFTPFFTTKANGQGLGLTLIQEILEHHRFEFSLESHSGGPTQFS
ncbi:MAG: ATP-binding protein, partial [candidate division KSB1 bacterium]